MYGKGVRKKSYAFIFRLGVVESEIIADHMFCIITKSFTPYVQIKKCIDGLKINVFPMLETRKLTAGN